MVHVILISTIGLGFLTRKSSKIFQSIPFVILLLFSALRYMYGNDYSNYQERYYLIQNGFKIFDESLYVWLNRVFPSFFLLIGTISLFFIAVIYWLVSKNVSPKYICFSIFVFVISPYLFLMNLSAIRQCIATLLFIIAVHFSRKKNYIVYILLILVATQFHSSSIVLLPFLFLANDKPFTKFHVISFLVLFLLFFTTDSFSSIIEHLASQFEDSNYLYFAQQGAQNSSRATLLSSVFLIYTLLNISELRGTDLMYSKLYLVSTALSVLSFRLSMITRIQMYFDLFAIVALPAMFQHNLEKGRVHIDKNKIGTTIIEILKRYVLPALIVLIYFLRYYSFFTNPLWKSFTNYQTIFSAT